MTEKKTEQITIWLPESLKVDLMHMAADGDRKLSDYIRHALILHAYGHSRAAQAECEAVNSGDARR